MFLMNQFFWYLLLSWDWKTKTSISEINEFINFIWKVVENKTYLLFKFTKTDDYNNIHFSSNYLKTLKHKQKESIITIYLLSSLVEKYFLIKNFLFKVDKNWVSIFENNIF